MIYIHYYSRDCKNRQFPNFNRQMLKYVDINFDYLIGWRLGGKMF